MQLLAHMQLWAAESKANTGGEVHFSHCFVEFSGVPTDCPSMAANGKDSLSEVLAHASQVVVFKFLVSLLTSHRFGLVD